MAERYRVHESDYGTQNYDVDRRGDTLEVTLTNLHEGGAKVRYVTVGQESTLASIPIRVHFDQERNGYVVERPAATGNEDGDEPDREWVEAAFIGNAAGDAPT